MTVQDIERARKVFSEKLHASDGLRHYLEVVVPSHSQVNLEDSGRRDLEVFVRADLWDPKRTATGKAHGDHDRYRKRLPDGSVLNTKISHPIDNTILGGLWESTIRPLQLQVTEE